MRHLLAADEEPHDRALRRGGVVFGGGGRVGVPAAAPRIGAEVDRRRDVRPRARAQRTRLGPQHTTTTTVHPTGRRAACALARVSAAAAAAASEQPLE